MSRKALVVGASSGIGAALVRRLVADGWTVVGTARRAEQLASVCASANAKGPGKASPVVNDVTDLASIPSAWAAAECALGGLPDLVVYSSGVMPHVQLDEYDTGKDAQIVAVNVTGAMAWLNEAARRFDAAGRGTIVGIGSVAGDRGRVAAPAYNASKAALHSYLESLRNRLTRRGVHVLTVKPGPVRSEMTAGKEDLPLLVDAEPVADAIVAAVRSGRQELYVPWAWAPIMAVVRSIPSVLFRRTQI